MMDRVYQIISESIEVKKNCLEDLPPTTAEACALIIGALSGGGKVLTCGNGGSAADAQHLAGEMVVKYARERDAFPVIALTTDSSVLTAQANDVDFSTIFSRQVEALGKPGDVLVAISTSGGSPDILEAVKAAGDRQMKVIGLTGADGYELARMCDVAIVVPSASTPRIQEAHITAIHAICDIVEAHFC